MTPMECEARLRAMKLWLIRTLAVFSVAWLLGLGLVLGLRSSAEDRVEALTVRRLTFVDEQGRPRFVLAAPLPNPVVQGKEYPRSAPVYGLQLLDPAGNEVGGLGIQDTVEGRILCFDHSTAEAMCFVKAKNYTGLSFYDVPAPESAVGRPGPARFEMSLVEGNVHLALSDTNGKERIVLGVDAKNNAEMKLLDGEGKVVFKAPQ